MSTVSVDAAVVSLVRTAATAAVSWLEQLLHRGVVGSVLASYCRCTASAVFSGLQRCQLVLFCLIVRVVLWCRVQLFDQWLLSDDSCAVGTLLFHVVSFHNGPFLFVGEHPVGAITESWAQSTSVYCCRGMLSGSRGLVARCSAVGGVIMAACCTPLL